MKTEESFQMIRNTAGKGEIACYEQFLLSPVCFQETKTADKYKQGRFGERVIASAKIIDPSQPAN